MVRCTSNLSNRSAALIFFSFSNALIICRFQDTGKPKKLLHTFTMIFLNNRLEFNEVLFVRRFDSSNLLILCNLTKNMERLLIPALEKGSRGLLFILLAFSGYYFSWSSFSARFPKSSVWARSTTFGIRYALVLLMVATWGYYGWRDTVFNGPYLSARPPMVHLLSSVPLFILYFDG